MGLNWPHILSLKCKIQNTAQTCWAPLAWIFMLEYHNHTQMCLVPSSPGVPRKHSRLGAEAGQAFTLHSHAPSAGESLGKDGGGGFEKGSALLSSSQINFTLKTGWSFSLHAWLKHSETPVVHSSHTQGSFCQPMSPLTFDHNLLIGSRSYPETAVRGILSELEL